MLTDPADLALEEYRNSKDYPDDVNYGIWGRINRAFQDGYAKAFKDRVYHDNLETRTVNEQLVEANDANRRLNAESHRREEVHADLLINYRMLGLEKDKTEALYRAECRSNDTKGDHLQNVVSQLKAARERLRDKGVYLDIDIPEAYR